MTFNRNGPTSDSTELTLADLISARGSDLVEMISVQTDSGWGGFDGYMDGLEITLANGNVGRVNFGAVVPLPVALWPGLALLGGMAIGTWRKRRRNR